MKDRLLYFALLDNNFTPHAPSYLFQNPIKFILCTETKDVIPTLKKIEDEQKRGNYACGYITYEAAGAYGVSVKQQKSCTTPKPPLVYFGVFKNRITLNTSETEKFLAKLDNNKVGCLVNLSLDTTFKEYTQTLQTIKRHLRAGNSYQVNFTMRYTGYVGGNINNLYFQLRTAQPVAYGALLNFPLGRILSRSPELFFNKDEECITATPMKGTKKRNEHYSNEQELLEINALIQDPKQQSENVMIVDLLRNDLGKIAHTGSVHVDKMLMVEKYKTIYQIISKITCKVDKDIPLHKLIDALFPCGSITGAPKLSTCAIIKDVEKTQRGVYTGAIGYITPENNMCFSVPIRTLIVHDDNQFTFGVGGGILYESDIREEFLECNYKARFLLNTSPKITLIEAFLWDPVQGFLNYDLHMERLLHSASAMNFTCPHTTIEEQVKRAVANHTQSQKVRIELMKDGNFKVETSPLTPTTSALKYVTFSPKTIESRDILYQHKTSQRHIFDEERVRLQNIHPVHEVLFTNDKGHLTEASYHSIFLRFGTQFRTPPLTSGVLNGVGRALFITQHQGHVQETAIPKNDVFLADEILLVSSIRGVFPVKILPHA